MMGDFNAYPPNEPGHPDLAGFLELSLALKTEKGMARDVRTAESKRLSAQPSSILEPASIWSKADFTCFPMTPPTSRPLPT
jgi:hypothetical protein